MVRTAFATLALLFGTLVFGSLVLLAQLAGVAYRPGSVFERAPVWWARWLLRAAGVRVVLHGGERIQDRSPRVYVANHISWFDIPALFDVLPHFGFLAKRELESIPLFGSAARAVGVIYVDRENRKAAFSAIDDAAEKVRSGRSVVVYPEGTRGVKYPLRPFKKGAFVLAIRAGAPVVPVVIYGTIAVNPRGEFRASPGVVHVHVLEPIETHGLSYEERDGLSETVRLRMAACLREVYGIDPALEARTAPRAATTSPELSM